MENREASLLREALVYEQGHRRRTEHILKVYALAGLLGQEAGLPEPELTQLRAAAILHDIPIRYCKARFGGDAGQENQRRAAPELVASFLERAGYPPEDVPPVLELVVHHHDPVLPGGALGVLMEADRIVNCYETDPPPAQLDAWQAQFRTQAGRELFAAYRQGADAAKDHTTIPPQEREREAPMNEIIERLTWKMTAFDQGDPKRIQHFLKVHRFAQLIGRGEALPAHTQFVLECASLVHDIGIRPAERRYGRCNGKLQEQEGPAYARTMLTELGLEEADVERVCYLVGHHHTYDGVDGPDYQILLEADLLVNVYEDELDPAAAETAAGRILKTVTGKHLYALLYGGEDALQ